MSDKNPNKSVSLALFRGYIKRNEVTGMLDASGVISHSCYAAWLARKHIQESDVHARRYHRILTNHVTGVDKRTPFDEEEEEAVLKVLRLRQPWPCFPSHLADIGNRFRARGYHEKRRGALENDLKPPITMNNNALIRTPILPVISLAPPAISTPAPATEIFMHEEDDDDIDSILRSLAPGDREYIKAMADYVAARFVHANYCFEDWIAFQDLLRQVAVDRLGLQTGPDCVEAAQRLCAEHTARYPAATVIVYDLTAKTMVERHLAHNKANFEFFGEVVGNPNFMMWQMTELYSMMVCAAAALHNPGKRFHALHALEDEDFTMYGCFEMVYCMDPATSLLVVCGHRVLMD